MEIQCLNSYSLVIREVDILRILQMHSNYIEYKLVKKEISSAEESDEKKQRFEELVVLLTSIEKGDDFKTAIKAIDEVKSTLEKLKINRILIYPYAHLSNNLTAPQEALKILKKME